MECAALAVAIGIDIVWALGQPPVGGAGALVGVLTLAVGPAAGALAVLRRLLPDRLMVLSWLAVLVSFTASAWAAGARNHGSPISPQPGVSETLALALLLGAACRRLDSWRQAVFPVCAGLAMVSAPLLRDAGTGWALLAAPAAQAWGIAVGAGLLQRDADRRTAAELAAVRTSERLALARDLHDLVIHYVTGIVVRTQAARVVASMSPEGVRPADQATFYDEIEQAGANAVKAMRHLVGMLREDTTDRLTSLRDAVLKAVGDDERVRLDLPDDLDRLARAPELATTVHRVVLESLTNARRHAPQATYVSVALRTERNDARGTLVLEVVNDGVSGPERRDRRGFGLAGMGERVRALGGTVHTGPEPGRLWRVTAHLPLSVSGPIPQFLSEASP